MAVYNANPYYPQSFQPMYPYTAMPQVANQPVQQQVPVQPVNSNPIVWVQGEAGAKSYLVGANQSVLLMDSESNSFYIKSTDASGMPAPLRIFDYTERTQQNTQPQVAVTESHEVQMPDLSNYVTYDELDKRLASIRRQPDNQQKSNGKARTDA